MAGTSGGLVDRMVGAALLDVDTFEEVEHDESATAQAAAVVFFVALCQAVGALDTGLLYAGWMGVLEIGSWLVWAGITYVVGDRIFGGEATWGELLRTLGFAKAPGVLFLAGVVPILGLPVLVMTSLWMTVAAFVAIRQALDIGNFKTLLTVLIGGAVYGALQSLPIFPF